MLREQQQESNNNYNGRQLTKQNFKDNERSSEIVIYLTKTKIIIGVEIKTNYPLITTTVPPPQ